MVPHTVPTPSRYILQKAWKLGQKMAYKERRLWVDISNCHQYPSYPLFRSVHRHRLEQANAFLPWDAKLQDLCDREASASGLKLDTPSQWDAFHSRIAAPIRSAFWYGWEQVHGLETKYNEAVEAHARQGQTHAKILRVYATPADRSRRPATVPSALPEGDELTIWETMARKLFDEMANQDDRLWELPPPDEVIRPREREEQPK